MSLTTGQVSACCSVAIRTVRRWLDGGGLKGYKMPGKRGRQHRRVLKKDLLAFLAKNKMPIPEALQIDAGV